MHSSWCDRTTHSVRNQAIFSHDFSLTSFMALEQTLDLLSCPDLLDEQTLRQVYCFRCQDDLLKHNCKTVWNVPSSNPSSNMKSVYFLPFHMHPWWPPVCPDYSMIKMPVLFCKQETDIFCKQGRSTPDSWLRGSRIRHTWPQTRKEIETLFHSFLWQSSWPIFSWFQVILAWLQYVLEFGTNTCSRSSSRTWREWGRVCSFSGSQGIQGITLTSSSS